MNRAAAADRLSFNSRASGRRLFVGVCGVAVAIVWALMLAVLAADPPQSSDRPESLAERWAEALTESWNAPGERAPSAADAGEPILGGDGHVRFEELFAMRPFELEPAPRARVECRDAPRLVVVRVDWVERASASPTATQ